MDIIKVIILVFLTLACSRIARELTGIRAAVESQAKECHR